MSIQFLVALVATLSFAILFAAPPNRYLHCAVGGGLCWLVYLLIARQSGSGALASFGATFVLVFFSRLTGYLAKTPIIIFITTGIFPLVPGAGIYYTAYNLFLGQLDIAAQRGLETLVSAGTITLGMLFGYALPQKFFEKMGHGCKKLAGLLPLRPKKQ